MTIQQIVCLLGSLMVLVGSWGEPKIAMLATLYFMANIIIFVWR